MDGAPSVMERRRRSDSPRIGTRVAMHPAEETGGSFAVRVVKVGGRAQSDPRLVHALASVAAKPDTRLLIVHGGGDEVTQYQKRLGLESQFVGGRRVTSAADLEVVRMVLSGTVNKRLVAQLASNGARAVGVSGEDGRLLSARVTDPSFGRVGHEVICDASILADLLNSGWVPVISPLARDRESPTGEGLNVNGDDAASAIASGIGADELLFIADVPGVMDQEGSTIPLLDLEAAQGLADSGVVKGGMRAKLEAGESALRNGVQRVRIASIDGILDTRSGTRLFASESAAVSRGDG